MALLVVVLLAVSGCGGGTQPVAMSLRDASSAVASARLALESSQESHVFPTVATVMVDEALTQLSGAQTQLSAFEPATDRDSRTLESAAAALAQADAAVRSTRDSLAGFKGSPSPRKSLDEITDAERLLDAAAKQAGPPR